jgi:Domain of unknown function (DUF4351)
MMEPRELIDRSLKVLTRHAAHALCRLADIAVAPDQIRFEDTAVNVAAHRADNVLLLGEEGDPARWGWYLEYQIEPDARVMKGWLVKHAVLNARLPVPVVLTVAYLTRGDRATFPDTYRFQGDRRSNDFRYDTLHLWDYAEEIRSGQFAELAPLLVLCEDRPTEATLRRERALILGLGVPRPVQVEMLAVAMMVGTRYFARDVLERLFHREIEMFKQVPFIEDWLEESEARGEARGIRDMLLRLLRAKFGDLPEAMVERVESADREWCEAIGERLFEVNSLDELRLLENGSRDVPE